MENVLYAQSRLRARSAKFLVSKIIGLSVVVAAVVPGVLMPSTVHAAGETIGGGSNITATTDAYVPVTGVSVTGPASNVVPINLSVDSGQLSMTTTTGLTFTGGTTGNNLVFQGTVSNVNAALATLRYKTYTTGTVTFSAQLTSAGEVFFPDNGHIYEIVHDPGIDADSARVAAAARTKYGVSGYLATITTQEENDYVGPRLSGDGWFGASDAGVEGDWQWITGPEAGTPFWSGLGANNGGSPVGSLYSNWATGEPNDVGNEDCAQFYSNGAGWNDLPCAGTPLDYYVVEYGAPGSLPTVSSTDFTITTTHPTPSNVPIGSCLDLINVAANAEDHRYDTLTLTANIDCTGQSLSPMFADTDPAFGELLNFHGTFDGDGFGISNISISSPSNDNIGFIGSAEGATIRDLSVQGSVTGQDCVGGIVGIAVDTAFINADSAVDITAHSGAGGIVGCIYAIDGDASITNSIASGDIDASYTKGGVVGMAETDNDQLLTITDNTFFGTLLDDSASHNGGIAGEVEADGGGDVTFSNNTTTGALSLPNAAYTGGIVGEIELFDDNTMTMENNAIGGAVQGYYGIGGLVGVASLYAGSRLDVANQDNGFDVTGTDELIGGLIGLVDLTGVTSTTAFTLSDASVSGDVHGTGGLGGLIGELRRDTGNETSIVHQTSMSGDVTGVGLSVGGLMGYANGTQVSSSSVTGTVEATTDGYTGGLIGEMYGASVIRSYVTGDVLGGGGIVGGIVGDFDGSSTLTEVYATGLVDGGGDNIGGLVGRSFSGSIVRSYATGDVSTSGIAVGGLAGAYYGTLEDSYARGSVSGNTDVGGLLGICGNELTNSFSTGEVSGGAHTGGLVGWDDNCDAENSYWDADTSGMATSAVGDSKTTSEMKTRTTFTAASWNFASVWSMVPSVNDGYPCLMWTAGSCAINDGDADGISATVENAAPNGGDGNNDGTLDSLQTNVASFNNEVNNTYSTVVLPVACSVTSATSQAESSQTVQDVGFTYQGGFTRFVANCGTPGYVATVKVYQYGLPMAGLIVRKYNPTTHAYFTIPGAILSQQTISAQLVSIATYDITDGGILDVDATANGVIVDPVGLGRSVVGAPNTGLGGRR